MLVLLLVVSTISDILVVAGLPSAVDFVMFLLSLLLLASLHAVANFTVLQASLLLMASILYWLVRLL